MCKFSATHLALCRIPLEFSENVGGLLEKTNKYVRHFRVLDRNIFTNIVIFSFPENKINIYKLNAGVSPSRCDRLEHSKSRRKMLESQTCTFDSLTV